MDRLIKLTFLGDIMCQREQISAVRRRKTRYDVIFDQVKHLWCDSDYVIGNLETPIAGRRLRYAYEEMRFNAPDEFAVAIKNAGIDFVSIANNHILDRGKEGLDNTIRTLDKLGIEHSGAYITKSDSDELFIKDVSGIRFAIVACTYGVNQGLKCNYLPDEDLWRVDILKYPQEQVTTRTFLLKRFLSNLVPWSLKKRLLRKPSPSVYVAADSVLVEEFGKAKHAFYFERIVNKIKKAKEVADIVIALPHIGGQYCTCPGPWQLKVEKSLIDAGADLVIANHAHVTLPIKSAHGVIVAHCLGDFCGFPKAAVEKVDGANRSLLLNCYFDVATHKLVRYDGRGLMILIRGDGVAIPVPTRMRFNEIL